MSSENNQTNPKPIPAFDARAPGRAIHEQANNWVWRTQGPGWWYTSGGSGMKLMPQITHCILIQVGQLVKQFLNMFVSLDHAQCPRQFLFLENVSALLSPKLRPAWAYLQKAQLTCPIPPLSFQLSQCQEAKARNLEMRYVCVHGDQVSAPVWVL